MELEIDELGKRWPGADLSIKQSQEIGKNICEEKSVNNKNLNSSQKVNAIKWKQLISVEIRYRSLIKKALGDAKLMGFDNLIHLDCDMLLVGDLNKLINSKLNSINLLIRENKYDEINRKIFGCLIILKTNDYSFQFLDILKRIIDQQDFHSQKKGFGQTALFFAYKEFGSLSRKNLIGRIDLDFISSDWIKNKTIYYSGNYLDKSKIKIIMSALIPLRNLPFFPLLGNIFIFFIRFTNRFSIELKSLLKSKTKFFKRPN